jgi:D-aminoacyl-tRNA deacylase
MVFVVYSPLDPVSVNAAEAIKECADFNEVDKIGGMRHFSSKKIDLLELNTIHLYADFLDDYLKTDLIIFMSRHGSIKNIAAFTVHAEGNWGNEAKLGGKPSELSVAAPVQMARLLCTMARNNTTKISVTYEATHHGPLLKTPSMYAEIGGTNDVRENLDYAMFLAKSVVDSLDDKTEYEKVAIGIGGLHYSDRFARQAISGRFAFSHILPKHYADNVDMLGQAVERSVPRAEIAVMEWKGLRGPQREAIIKKLDEIGLDYEKI